MGLSQRELGWWIGLSENVVSSRVTRYESGTSEPNFQTATRLAHEVGVPLADLFADSDELAEIILAASIMPLTEQKKLTAKLKIKRPYSLKATKGTSARRTGWLICNTQIRKNRPLFRCGFPYFFRVGCQLDQ